MISPQLSKLRSFASLARFTAEVQSSSVRPGYVLAGDELFLLDECRKSAVRALAPPEIREFALHDLDLAETSLFEILALAQTPSLMAPSQLIFIRNLKLLYARGSKKEEFAAIEAYFRSPNPGATLIFLADHLHIPTDLRRMDLQDKERFDRIRETLGDVSGVVELAAVSVEDAAQWVIETSGERGVLFEVEAARELVDALGANMMLVQSECEKLMLYADGLARLSATGAEPKPRVTPAEVEAMVLAAKQRSLYELTDAISARDPPRAVLLLHGLLNQADSGEEAAIGHIYMLARTFRQMLVILEKNVRDSRSIWQALWPGFRMPPFAVDDLIRQAHRYRSRGELSRALRLIGRADLDLRSSPVSKRLVLERLVLALASEAGSGAHPRSELFVTE